MSKLKHVQLFENFSEGGKTPMIVATADYSKILKNPEDGRRNWDDYMFPNKFIITYYTNPSPELEEEYINQQKKLHLDHLPEFLSSPHDAAEELLTGNENGVNVTSPEFRGKVIVKVDPSYSPDEYEKACEYQIEGINGDPDTESMFCEDVLRRYELPLDTFTPEFIAHCKKMVSEDSFAMQDPMVNKLVEGPKQKMEPRVEMEFTII